MLTYSQLRRGPRRALGGAPLPRPLTLYVEPTNACNFRCEMCPESLADYKKLAGYFQHMSMETWGHVLQDLREWGPVTSLKFYFEGEPLLNRNLAAMIRQAYEAGVAQRLELTTNLSVLTKGMAEELVESGLDYVRVSVYGVGGNSNETVTGTKYTSWDILDRGKILRAARDRGNYGTPYIFAQCFAGIEEEAQFRKLWGPVADECGTEPLHNWSGSLVGIGGTETREACAAPFYMLAVHANGDVSGCCVDWARKLKVGSVLTTRLWDIWNGIEMVELRTAHQRGKRCEIEACAGCTARFPDKVQMTVDDAVEVG